MDGSKTWEPDITPLDSSLVSYEGVKVTKWVLDLWFDEQRHKRSLVIGHGASSGSSAGKRRKTKKAPHIPWYQRSRSYYTALMTYVGKSH